MKKSPTRILKILSQRKFGCRNSRCKGVERKKTIRITFRRMR
jgi:hypothetical protein